MGDGLLLLERDDDLAVLTLNRPEKRNALNAALRSEMAGRSPTSTATIRSIDLGAN